MQVVHVAVAVILNSQQEVLLAFRQAHQHQGGLWEFPGGKVNAGESVYNTLVREINEELGVEVTAAEALIKVSHDYVDKSVLLDVWHVVNFSGIPIGREGQQLRWCAIDDLNAIDFPAANTPIISAVQSQFTE